MSENIDQREQIEEVIPLIEAVTDRLSATKKVSSLVGQPVFKFDRKSISLEAQDALLCLHGQLPDLKRALEDDRV